MSIFNNRRIILAALLTALLSSGVHAAEKLNPRTLCPLSGSIGQTILLIDTTDPLTLVAQERLKQLLKGLGDPENDHYLQPAHELIVYRLASRIADMKRPLRVCNPGHPEDINILFESKADALRKWRSFELMRRRSLPRTDEQVKGEQSPLLESISWVTAKHIPNFGVGETHRPTRLILFSDMLQNSDLLSHYRYLPTMKAFKALVGYPAMSSNLNGAKVWLFYVRRTGLEHVQTAKHHYWWTRVIKDFGGHPHGWIPL